MSSVLCLISCGSSPQLHEVTGSESSIKLSVPDGLHITKDDKLSLMLEGNKKFVHCIRTTSADEEWNLEKFAADLNYSDPRVHRVISTDTLIAYEIHVGSVTIPANILSIHRVDTLSYLLITMGYSQDTHEQIGKTIGSVNMK